ncbi:MAG: hypothetical protein LBG76_05420 [Treponema sp.]|jgi:hypothetical protein|nr:hypothetical protein [Treponema sp.]
MTIEERTVSDKNGNTGDPVIGTLCPVDNDPYRFYVKIDQNTPVRIIKMVLPVGGIESGLYRFPRVGEKVLIGVEGSSNYLMGYLPDATTQPFSAAANQEGDRANNLTLKEVVNKKGQVFRYRQTGKKTPEKENEYSEIGFYHEKTKWETGTPADYIETDSDIPKIDRIKIRSTGDIETGAANYQGIQAKRMEIAVNKELAQRAKAGDFTLDTKHDIIISSDTSITFRVGRSSITINDTGITLRTMKVSTPFTGTWDTLLLLTPYDGVAMSGPHIKITGLNDVSMGDRFGGGFSSNLGISRVNGVDIKLETFTGEIYRKNYKMQIMDLILNVMSIGAGLLQERVLVGKSLQDIESGASGVFPSVMDCVRGGFMAHQENTISTKSGYKDFVGALAGAVELASQIAAAVAAVLSLTIPAWKIPGVTAGYIKDSIYSALALTEAGLGLGAVSAITAKTKTEGNMIFDSTTNVTDHLQIGGALYINAKDFKSNTTEAQTYNSPLAGIDLGALAKIGGKYPLRQAVVKMTRPLTALGMKIYSILDPELNEL